MAWRDRFFTPQTARAIRRGDCCSALRPASAERSSGCRSSPRWPRCRRVRAAVALAMPRAPKLAAIDPFAVGEPWRHFVKDAQRARQQLQATVRGTPAGPLRERLESIAQRLDAGLQQGWQIARRGDEIDGAVRRLDPTRLRSRRSTLEAQPDRTPELDGAIGLGGEPARHRRPPEGAVGIHGRPAATEPGPARRAGGAGGRGEHRLGRHRRRTPTTSTSWCSSWRACARRSQDAGQSIDRRAGDAADGGAASPTELDPRRARDRRPPTSSSRRRPSGLVRNNLVVATGTALSRLTGLVRVDRLRVRHRPDRPGRRLPHRQRDPEHRLRAAARRRAVGDARAAVHRASKERDDEDVDRRRRDPWRWSAVTRASRSSPSSPPR